MTRQEELNIQRWMLERVVSDDRLSTPPLRPSTSSYARTPARASCIARQGLGALEEAGAIVVEGDHVRPSNCIRHLRALRVVAP